MGGQGGGSRSFSFSFGGPSSSKSSFGFGMDDIFSSFFGGDMSGGSQFGGFRSSGRSQPGGTRNPPKKIPAINAQVYRKEIADKGVTWLLLSHTSSSKGIQSYESVMMETVIPLEGALKVFSYVLC